MKLADLHPWHLVVKNGNFTFLLLELLLADEVADLLADLPPVLPSSGPKWQFTFLLLEFILADQLADLPPSVQCILGCLLWDVIGSHCGFFKKRWEFAFISE